MECRLVYALVPISGSFEQMVHSRAWLVAQRMVGDVSHTMALEDQTPASDAQSAMIDDLAQDLVRRLPRELWDQPA